MPSPAPLPGFDFFETNEKGATAAEMSFIRGVKDQLGNFRAKNLLKRDAAYRRGANKAERTSVFKSELISGCGDGKKCALVGSLEFSQEAISWETNENNDAFIDALRISNNETVGRYTCPAAYLTPDDLRRIRVQMQANLKDMPALGRPMKILISACQFNNFIEKNDTVQSSDFVLHGGTLEAGKLPTYLEVTFESNSRVNDGEAFAYIPRVTVACSDWGVVTKVEADAEFWPSWSARREYQYDCKVVEPLTLIQISFTGSTTGAIK